MNEAKSRVDAAQGIGVTLYFPGSPKIYKITEPILIEDPWIRVKGDGPETKLVNYGQGPCFISGLRSTERTRTRVAALDPRYYPSPPAGFERLGLGRRLLGDSSIGFYGSSYDLGRLTSEGFTRWRGCKQLTIEFAIDFNQKPHYQHGIFSLGLGGYTPKVFYLGTSGNKGLLDFHYTTDEGTFARSFAVDPLGFNLISIKLDLGSGSCDFWVNGTSSRVAVPVSASGLIQNQFDPFLIGCDNNTSDGRQPLSAPGQKMPDFTIYGLRISDTIVDGPPLQNSLDLKCVAQLFNDIQTGTRLVSAFTGANGIRKFYGYHIQVDQGSLLGGLVGTSFEDMQLSVGNPVSPVIQTVGTLKNTHRRLVISGGTHAISLYPSSASYPINLEELRLSARDYSVAASWAVVRANNIEFFSVGRGAFLAHASDVRLRQAFVAFTSPDTDTIYSAFRGHYGGMHQIDDLVIDMEGEVCRLSPFYVEKSDNVTSGLRLNDIYLGSSAKDRPIVISKKSVGQGKYYVELEHIDDAGGKPSTQIEERLP